MTLNTEVKTEEKKRGDRGEVGTATTSKAIKKLWREDASGLSLKAFAHRLSKNKTNTEFAELAMNWFSHKHHDLEEAPRALRLKDKGATIAAQKLATKNARKKKKTDKPAAAPIVAVKQ